MPKTRPFVVAQLLDRLALSGKERVAVNTANGLAGRGYESHLISSRVGGALQAAVSPHVHVWICGRTRRWDFGGMRRIASYIDNHEIDLVHSHNYSSSNLTRFVLRFCRRKPLHVVTDHGPGLQSRARAFVNWMMLRKIDGFVGVTEALRDRARRHLPLPHDRCIFVANGIEIPTADERPDGDPTVVQIAHLKSPKAHGTALRAAAMVRDHIPSLKWILVGRIPEPPTEYVENMHKLIGSLKLSETVILAGEVTDIHSVLQQAHVGVLTSDAEAFPLSVLEYMAAGLPVVMTDVGGAPSVLRDADAGIVQPPEDAVGIAEAVRRLLTNPGPASEMGRRGRDRATRDFSVEAMTERLDGLYTELLESRRRGI